MAADEKRNGSPIDESVEADQGTSSSDAHAADSKPVFESLAKQLTEIREYIAYYFSVRADALGVRLRSAAVLALLAVAGGLALSAAIATAVVLMVVGLADGLTVLFGDRPWAGKLAAGALVLGFTCAAAWLGNGSWRRASFAKLREKYARRREEQRKELRRDVRQRAAENAPAG